MRSRRYNIIIIDMQGGKRYRRIPIIYSYIHTEKKYNDITISIDKSFDRSPFRVQRGKSVVTQSN